MNYRHIAGAFIFIGAVQFILGLHIAEFLYPKYSISENYISDLGATCRNGTCITNQPSAFIFNSTIFLFGFVSLIGAYFLGRVYKNQLSLLLRITSIGMMGVGLFPETYGIIHKFAAFIAFFFSGLSAIFSYKLLKKPFAYLSALMGLISLIALALFGSELNLGLGPGGMERMIMYPSLLWALGLGGYLMSYKT